MTDPFVQALREWQNFYFMVGSASATLIGLMFVAVSLGADLPAATDATGISTFVMPMLVHFGSVVLIAAEMLIPTFRQLGLGLSILVTGIAFTAYSCRVAWQFYQHPSRNFATRSDWKWYVVFPIVGDSLVIVMALLLLFTGSLDSFDLLAVAAIFLVLISVRNTWDLMMWIAQSRRKAKDE